MDRRRARSGAGHPGRCHGRAPASAGFVLAGFVLAGFVVPGLVTAGFATAGLATAGFATAGAGYRVRSRQPGGTVDVHDAHDPTPRRDRTGSPSTTATDIVVRHPRFDFSDLPRRWIAGSALATCVGNAGHVFIPLGEQFFIDTVRAFRDRVDDPELRAAVNAFIGQEAVHRRAHEALWDRLRADGVPVERFERVIESIRSLEAYLPDSFRLAVTAALEHYTAAFGSAFLTEDLSEAVPDEMARLLAWHGMEELEHRSVAFDVLEVVDGRYVIRLAGFAFATVLLVVVPATGTAMFAVAELRSARRGSDNGDEPTGRPTASLLGMSARFASRMGAHVLSYLRPGFHPSEMDEPEQLRVWELEFSNAERGPARPDSENGKAQNTV